MRRYFKDSNMKIRTAQLTGPALDWAVASLEFPEHQAEQLAMWVTPLPCDDPDDFKYQPSTDWAQGGPVIDRELIQLTPHCMVNPLHGWAAAFRSFDEDDNVFALHRMRGRTPLRAAMRCYVASKLGDTVDIPKELL